MKGRGTPLLLLLALAAPSAAAGRAASQAAFDLQQAIDRARPGDVVRIPSGVHRGHFRVTLPLTLQGEPGAVVDGEGEGDVIRIEAEGVTVRGLTIRGTGDSLDRENAGLTVLKGGALIEDNRLEDVLFGIYLKDAPGSVIRRNRVGGKELDIARRGDALRLWYSPDCRIEDNLVANSRDAVMWFSDRVLLSGNHVSDCRYGLHFMYSDDNRLEGNLLEHNSVGAFLMYSQNLTVYRNTFRGNRGPSGYGIGLKDMDGVDARGNLILGNRIGLYLDNSPGSVNVTHHFQENVFAYNDMGVAFLPSVRRNRFSDNTFLDNLEQVAVLGGGAFPGNAFTVEGRGNFWSDYRGYDLDGDGIGDLPYRSESLFENLIDREPKLRLFLFSPAQLAIEAAAEAFPMMRPRVKLVDEAPLMTAHEVGAPVPEAPPARRMLATAALLLLLPAAMLGWLLRRFRSVNGSAPGGRAADAGDGARTLAVDGLSKRFHSFQALSGINFTVRSGEAVALWGANGAGKTTIIRCIFGLLRCEGRITLEGADLLAGGKQARRSIGYVPQELSLYDDLPAVEALAFYARLRRVPPGRVQEVLEQVALSEHSNKRVAALSGGMKQRLSLAAALLSDPPLLILDEMTANLDTLARSELASLLADLKRKGKTILFTSHRVDEVERLADRVLVLEDGRLAFECPPGELAGRIGLTATLRLFLAEDQFDPALRALAGAGVSAWRNGDSVLVDVEADRKALPLGVLARAGVVLRNFDVVGEESPT